MPENLAHDHWTLAYEDRGEGPPALLIHGFTTTARSWEPQLSGLAGYRLIAPDLPAHGASKADAGWMSMPCLAEMLAAMLGHLSVESAHVVGHSFGGALAIRFAADFPGLTRSLTVINSNSAAGDEGWQERMRPGLPRLAGALRKRGIKALSDTPVNPARSKRLPEALRAQIEADFEALDPEQVARFALAAMPDAWAEPHIRRVLAPALVVVGGRDKEFVQNYQNLVKGLRDVRVLRLDGAGHAAHLEQPAAFNQALLAFWREVERASIR